MSRIDYPFLTRALAWTVAITFVAGILSVVVMQLGLLGTFPEPREDFIDSVLANFEFERSLWPVEFIGIAALVIGFLALGALGPVLARLAAADDARGVLVSASFLAAGGLGAAAELALIGTRSVAISGELCECGLRAEEIMSRLMIMNVVFSIEMWFLSGALLSAAVGLIAAAGLGREAGMPAGWRWLAIGTAATAAVAAVLPHFQIYPFDLLMAGLVAGILLPAWALWLAIRSGDVFGTEARAL